MNRLIPSSVTFTFYLAAAVALGPLSTDMYLPTFPQLAAFFSATPAEVQLTLSIFTFGIGGCQLIYGPLTDRFGRKPVILGGLLIYVLASLACVVAVNIDQLVISRFFQALGACAAMVAPRAMVRDLFAREQAARQLSRMGTIMGLAPAIAPVIGGYIVVFYGWQSIFFILGLFGFIMALITLFLVDESLKVKDLNAIRPRHIVRNYSDLLRHREFLGYALTGGLCFGGLFSFISGSPLVLIEVFEVPANNFGYFFGIVVLGYMAGTLLGPYVTKSRGLSFSVGIGTVICALGGVAMLVAAWAGLHSISAVIIPMIVYTLGLGVVLPQSQAGAMAPFPEKAGSASALMGFLMLGFAALLGFLVAYFYDGTEMAMVMAIGLMGIGSALIFLLTASGSTEEHWDKN
ncbi:multidrug effflux MFS transporter [uncultured Sneathiella sp.]|jgi:DHA1 family bicyclomycin/chloramphenicol resistance-like MFS transporter|uniref:multidrug effflux MFS transporter n=1 Tax=uncultured Sneathiella sp. TaxID=879315 RepID=UPI0030DC4690|tara:strand:- start:145 stop:1356 length:1212 start_codon:yes stop_codon:yes gene_type:complete